MTLPPIPVAAPVLNGNERRYVLDCLDTNWISTRGDYVPRFEAAFAQTVGARRAVACSTGTAALHLSLLALGVGPGDEVIVPALTFVATANAVAYVGARPVIADIDPDTWALDPAGLPALIGPHTRALIPVHLYGHPAPMEAIRALAAGAGIAIIEDAAQAHGASYQGRPSGSLGDLGCFSFFGNKAITCGQGGMVTTDDAALAGRMRHLANSGMAPDRPYWHDCLGFNYRMTNIEAAIGLAQVERLDWHLARRREVAAWYRERLGTLPGVRFQRQDPQVGHGHWMVNVRLLGAGPGDIAACRQALAEQGIETRVGFPPLHTLPPYLGLGTPPRPVAETVSRESLTLPTHAALTEGDVERVCQGLAAWLDAWPGPDRSGRRSGPGA